MFTTIWRKLWRRNMLLAVDVGIDGITLVALQAQQQHWLLCKLITQKLQPGIVAQAVIVDWLKLQAQLTALIAQAKLQQYPVALALPNTIIMRKHIQLPAYLQDNELYETIRVALIEYFPGVNADKLHFDFVIEATTNEMHNILLLAVFKENLQQLLTIVAAAGLQVTILDIDIYACTRAATWYLTREQPTVKVAVIIVLHGATANFILWQHGQCVFAHSWQLTTASRFVAQVQQAWLLAQAALPAVAVDFIGINGNGHNLTQLAHELQLEFAVTTRVISILKNCNIAAPVSAALVAECSNKVLLCWGLAMRALPR